MRDNVDDQDPDQNPRGDRNRQTAQHVTEEFPPRHRDHRQTSNRGERKNPPLVEAGFYGKQARKSALDF
jgi:hypothetical protein